MRESDDVADRGVPRPLEGLPCAARHRSLAEAELNHSFGGLAGGQNETTSIQEVPTESTSRTARDRWSRQTAPEALSGLATIVNEGEDDGIGFSEACRRASEKTKQEIALKNQETEVFIRTWLNEQPPPIQQVPEPDINSNRPKNSISLMDALRATTQDLIELQARHNAIVAKHQVMSSMIHNF